MIDCAAAQVVDGLEQRDDVDVQPRRLAGLPAVPPPCSISATSSMSLTRVGLGDDVVGQRVAPKRRCISAAVSQDAQFACATSRCRRGTASAAAGAAPAPPAASAALRLVEGGIAFAVRTEREQFGDHLLVHAAVLAHVERRQVKAEHLRAARCRPRSRPRASAPGTVARAANRRDLQVVHEFLRVGIGLRLARSPRRIGRMLVERARGGREARVDAGQRAPVRLVAPVLGLVRRARGQLLELAVSPSPCATTATARRRAGGPRSR